MRGSIILLALLASAGAAQAGDRYGPSRVEAPPAPHEASRETPLPGRLLTWNNKAAAPAPVEQAAPNRPEAVSDWARRAEFERTGRAAAAPTAVPPPAFASRSAPAQAAPQPARTSHFVTPLLGGQTPSSVYSRAAAEPPRVAESIYTRAAAATPPTAPAALPTSIYAPAPAQASGYRMPAPPTGAPVEIKPQDLPNQPTLAQQMADDEEISMLEAKIARVRAMEAKGGANSALIQSQDAVR